jgi:membrane protein DedA with SNARE-associated domain
MMPGIRTVISVPAGLIEMPRKVFYFWTTLGSLIWVGGLAALGFILEEGFRQIEGYVDPVSKILVLTVAVLFFWQLWRIWRRPKV